MNESQPTTFTLENGQTYQLPQYQIFTPIYQRAPNANQQNNIMLNQQNGTSDELVCLSFLFFIICKQEKSLTLKKIISRTSKLI